MFLRMLLTLIIYIGCSISYGGGLSLSQSRIIFENNSKGEVLHVRNGSEDALLIQSSVVDYLNEKAVDNFIISPPLFKIGKESEYSIRIVPNKISNLPKDRESVFYLKVRGIPPTKQSSEDKDKAGMVFVTAILIKLIYRPEGIEQPIDEDFKKVKLTNKNKQWQFNNPTSHYMTVVGLKIGDDVYPESILISPFSQYIISNVSSSNSSKGSWRFLNDYGVGTEKFHYDLNEKL